MSGQIEACGGRVVWPVVLGGGVPATRSLGVARVIAGSNRPKRRFLVRRPNGHPCRIRWAAHANADAGMPSQAMQDLLDAFRDRQEASASQAPPTLEERRAAVAPRAACIRCRTTCW
jgi:hypothetical protein